MAWQGMGRVSQRCAWADRATSCDARILWQRDVGDGSAQLELVVLPLAVLYPDVTEEGVAPEDDDDADQREHERDGARAKAGGDEGAHGHEGSEHLWYHPHARAVTRP